jgi:hypothetical protein
VVCGYDCKKISNTAAEQPHGIAFNKMQLNFRRINQGLDYLSVLPSK